MRLGLSKLMLASFVLTAVVSFVGSAASAQNACEGLFSKSGGRVLQNKTVDHVINGLADKAVLLSPNMREGTPVKRFLMPVVLGNGQTADIAVRVVKSRSQSTRRRRWHRRIKSSRSIFSPEGSVAYVEYLNSVGSDGSIARLEFESNIESRSGQTRTLRYSGEVTTSQGTGKMIGDMTQVRSGTRPVRWITQRMKLKLQPLKAQEGGESALPAIQVADDLALSPLIEALVGAPDILEGSYVAPSRVGTSGPMRFSRSIVDINGKRAFVRMKLNKQTRNKIQAPMSSSPESFALDMTAETPNGKELSSLSLPFDRVWATSTGRTVRYASPIKTTTKSGTLVGLVHQETSYDGGRRRWATQDLEMRFIPDGDTEGSDDDGN
jgi:hypothetical protein